MVVFKSSKKNRKKKKKNTKIRKTPPGPPARQKAKSEETGLLGGAWRGWARAKISTLAHVGEAGPNPLGDEKGRVFLRRAGVGNITYKSRY